jgi:hypothetical protein
MTCDSMQEVFNSLEIVTLGRFPQYPVEVHTVACQDRRRGSVRERIQPGLDLNRLYVLVVHIGPQRRDVKDVLFCTGAAGISGTHPKIDVDIFVPFAKLGNPISADDFKKMPADNPTGVYDGPQFDKSLATGKETLKKIGARVAHHRSSWNRVSSCPSTSSY